MFLQFTFALDFWDFRSFFVFILCMSKCFIFCIWMFAWCHRENTRFKLHMNTHFWLCYLNCLYDVCKIAWFPINEQQKKKLLFVSALFLFLGFSLSLSLFSLPPYYAKVHRLSSHNMHLYGCHMHNYIILKYFTQLFRHQRQNTDFVCFRKTDFDNCFFVIFLLLLFKSNRFSLANICESLTEPVSVSLTRLNYVTHCVCARERFFFYLWSCWSLSLMFFSTAVLSSAHIFCVLWHSSRYNAVS